VGQRVPHAGIGPCPRAAVDGRRGARACERRRLSGSERKSPGRGSERRTILDGLGLEGTGWCTSHVFDDGERLFAAVVQQRLEGIIAKRLSSSYRPGERDWLKMKNRDYWRFGQELELARSRRRMFI
jgi:hypothetical protein